MKRSIIHALLWLPATLLAQNYPQYNGGSGSGFAEAKGGLAVNNSGIFEGSSGDGHHETCAGNLAISLLLAGGSGDGHSKAAGDNATTALAYAGGAGDGHSMECAGTQVNNELFAGGMGDGHSKDDVASLNNTLAYGGGEGDGFAKQDGALRFGSVRLVVMLQGPYESTTDLMHDDLRFNGLVPNVEPYSAEGYAPSLNDGAQVDPAILNTNGPDAVVDWVQVEVRPQSDYTRPITKLNALLQRDGDIVALDNASPLLFNVPPGDYWVVVQHRNHLAVMTDQPIPLDCIGSTYDLTLSDRTAFGTEPQKAINGRHVMWAGDVTHNGQLKYTGFDNDRDPILQAIGGGIPTNTVSGYYWEDVNMNGIVQYTGQGNDRDPILVNIGGSVPTAVRNSQVP